MLRNSHCILDLAPRYMVVLRCSSPVCVVTIFEERLIALSSLEWCHVTFCRWKGILFVWKGREPLRFRKNILMVEFVRWSTWQIHLLGLMSLGSSTYPAVRVKNELGDSWSSVSFSNTGTQDWCLCSLWWHSQELLFESMCGQGISGVFVQCDCEHVHSSQYRSRFRGQRVGRGPWHNKRPRLNVWEFQSAATAQRFCPFWLIKPVTKNKDTFVLWPCC